MNPLTEGKRLKLGYDYFSEGFTGPQLSEAYYRLSADRMQERLLFETATLAQMDEAYNPGDPCDENDRMETTESGMVMESIRVKTYARTEKTMAALVRVFNTHLADKNIEAQAPIVGRPKKSGLFATVTVQIPFSDGQTVSIIFHSPDNNKMKITADDEIIAFRWLLNKRDITHVVSPEGDAEVSLQEVGKRTAQLVEKNTARFQVMQKDLVAQKKTLEDVTAKAGEAVARHEGLVGKLQDDQDATTATDAKIVNLKDRIEKQKSFNEGLQGKIDGLKAKQAGNDGKAVGGGTPKDEAAMKAEQVAEYYKSKCSAFQDELRGRGFAIGDKTGGVLAFYQNPALQVSLAAVGQEVFIEVIESDASGQTTGRKSFDSRTIKGMGSQVPKALAWIDKKLAEAKKAEPADTYLPTGWTESSPGGLATSKDPISGGMIDKEIASGKWFVIPENGSIEKMEGFATRKQAFDALEQMAARAASDKAVEEHNRLVAVGNEAVPGVRLQDAEIAGKLWEMKGRGELSQEDWDKYVADLKTSNKITLPTGPQAIVGATMTPEDEQRVLAELSSLSREELTRRHDEVQAYMEGDDYEAQDPDYKKSLQNTEFLLFTAKSNASTPEPAPADTAESALVQRANDILAGKYDSLTLGEVLKLAEPVMDLDEAKYADLMDKVDAYTTVLTKKAVQAKLAA